ncbi:hypothetical protein CDAR_479231 [Caerostris darwini]|uniref:Uncharacterized protein n=1 Tax=Caerostris darwini TaxID=1538125 RepID=A0AAV4UXW4_9ARAC|nr:hypothetical protein CDAR_479231 [Caerostris darwini]
MKTAYVEHSLSLTCVQYLRNRFRGGLEPRMVKRMADGPRIGQTHLGITDVLLNEIDQSIRANSTIKDISEEMGVFRFCSYHHYGETQETECTVDAT